MFLLLGVSIWDLEDGRGRSHVEASSCTGHSVHDLLLGNNFVFQNARLVLLNETHRKKRVWLFGRVFVFYSSVLGVSGCRGLGSVVPALCTGCVLM